MGTEIETDTVIVGDASMAGYELEDNHLDVLLQHFKKAAWLNPVPEEEWGHTLTIRPIEKIMGGHMYGLTPDGITEAAKHLVR